MMLRLIYRRFDAEYNDTNSRRQHITLVSTTVNLRGKNHHSRVSELPGLLNSLNYTIRKPSTLILRLGSPAYPTIFYATMCSIHRAQSLDASLFNNDVFGGEKSTLGLEAFDLSDKATYQPGMCIYYSQSLNS